MLTQTITAPAVPAAKVFPAPRAQTVPAVDQFSVIATCAGVIASEFCYRRQIGAFHLRGDVFGLDAGSTHRLTAEAIADTAVRLVKRRSLEAAAGSNVQVAHNLWTMTASDLRHAEDHMLLLGRKTRWKK
jgi:CRP/FNR family nitrogen fixation transcriptional regulator